MIGGLAAGTILYVIASGSPSFVAGGFASNFYGELSPGHYSLLAALLAIGLTLTLIHLISIPVTNTSVNPARSTAVAFFAHTGAAGQLWAFWVALLLGAAIGALVWTKLIAETESEGISEAREFPLP